MRTDGSSNLPERSSNLPDRSSNLPDRSSNLPDRSSNLPDRSNRPLQSVEELDSSYHQILAILEVDRPDLAAVLGHAVPLELTPSNVVIGWSPDGVLVASDRESVAALARAAEKHFGKLVSVSFEFDSERSRGRKTLAAADSLERAERTRAAYAAAQKHERITDAVEVLGAKLKELKLGGAA
jgi:hypothetical protein